jgi:hypothetical protein
MLLLRISFSRLKRIPSFRFVDCRSLNSMNLRA